MLAKPADDADAKAVAEPMAATAAAAATSGTGDDVNGPLKTTLPDISGAGTMTQSIDLEVPAFRGLEPSISLDYNSSRKSRLGGLYQGFTGFTWGLGGFAVIERASTGYGIPAFDAADVYLLKGEELVACATGMVAVSCPILEE